MAKFTKTGMGWYLYNILVHIATAKKIWLNVVFACKLSVSFTTMLHIYLKKYDKIFIHVHVLILYLAQFDILVVGIKHNNNNNNNKIMMMIL